VLSAGREEPDNEVQRMAAHGKYIQLHSSRLKVFSKGLSTPGNKEQIVARN